MSREEVLAKLIDLRRRQGDEMARTHAARELRQFEEAGLTVLPCTIHEFFSAAGLTIVDPADPVTRARLQKALEGIGVHALTAVWPMVLNQVFYMLRDPEGAGGDD